MTEFDLFPKLECIRCRRTPEDVPEYTFFREEGYASAEAYVRKEEDTYNPQTGKFACPSCYIALGCPTHPGGWRAGMTPVRTFTEHEHAWDRDGLCLICRQRKRRAS